MSSAERVLQILCEAGETIVSGGQICRELGITRSAVGKHVEFLRANGYVIEAQPKFGYKLVAKADIPWAPELLPLLTTRRLGKECCYVRETGSTNHDLSLQALQGGAEGLLLCAEMQSGGRGRMNRKWASPPGVNIYFSLLLRPAVEPSEILSLPLLAGLALAEALQKMLPATVQVGFKWPNDILLDGKKTSGILCEMHSAPDCVSAIIVGIGLNINMTNSMFPPELRTKATSLRVAGQRDFSRVEVLAEVLNTFEPLYDRWVLEGLVVLLPQIAAFDVLAGQEITLLQAGEELSGVAGGINSDGSLLLHRDNGKVEKIYSGDATLHYH